MSSVPSTPVTSGEAAKYADHCVEGSYWDRNFRHYGLDRLFFPSRYMEWADYIRNMQVRADDVWIVTFPKCGTTWTQEMVWLLMNNVDFEAAADSVLFDRSPFLEIDSMYRIPAKWNVADGAQPPPTSMEIVANMPSASPRVVKSHLPLSLLPKSLMEVKPKIIYVARDPRDACVSYYHHSRLIPGYRGTLDDFVDAFVTDNVVYSPFWPILKSFHALRNEPNVLFLTFEEMKADLKSVITKTARFLDKKLTAEQVSQLEDHLSFEKMKNNASVSWEPVVQQAFTVHKTPAETSFFRKGKVGSWREEKMSEESVRKLDAWMEANAIPGLYSSRD